MKELPILFNGAMVRAILEGRKTQTRRAVKPQPSYDFGWYPGCGNDGKSLHYANERHWRKGAPIDWSPYGQPGDRLWVRETTEADEDTSEYVVLSRYKADGAPLLYTGCDDPEYEGSMAHWDYSRPVRPSIHMPRWASRITLEITDVRVERLQDTSEEDAKAEGCQPPDLPPEIAGVAGDYVADERTSFAILWNRINGAGSWDANPWVWVVEFRRVEQ